MEGSEAVRSGASHTLLEDRSRAPHNLKQLNSRSAGIPADRPRWSPQPGEFEQGNGAEANVSELGRRLREFKLTSTIKFGDEQDCTFPSKALSDVGRYSRSKFYTTWESEEDDTNNFEEYTARSDTGPYGIRDFDAAHIGRQYAGGTNSKKRKTTTGFTSGSPGTDEEPPDGDEDSDPDEPPFRRGGGGKRPAQETPSAQDKALSKRYACPYFKKDPESHRRCRSWQTAELHRVKCTTIHQFCIQH
ncbi:hypothetical protein K440DRAFT_632346 [Wilcoxina mikolae CBS 423.85]|nr:hypothetical protein K440DRAFT_632346 [Wilcoxina mikolae CBS 423.85]